MKSFTPYPISTVACVFCGAEAAVHSREAQTFGYVDKGREVELTALIPVLTCSSCNESYAAEGAEEAHNNAVCEHLGRLTPAQIKTLRKERGLTQAELANLLDAGIASIKRWESGTVIQNASMDRQLRSVLEKPVAEKRKWQPKFRTQMHPEAYEAAERFILRLSTFSYVEVN